VLRLQDAVSAALAQNPQVRRAQANADAADFRVGQARAPLLPQLSGSASARFTRGPGISLDDTGGQLRGNQLYSVGLTASQLLFDYGQMVGRLPSASAQLAALSATATATRLSVRLSAELAFFSARAQKELLKVAQQTLENQDRHHAQVEALVKVGTRAAIDLLQVKTDRANARVQLINAQNGYRLAKATLNQTMGVVGTTEYEVSDELFPPLASEADGLDALWALAKQQRPELAASDAQVKAQESLVSAAWGGYLPSLSASAFANETGPTPSDLDWKIGAQVNLSWSLFQGFLTHNQVREARAQVAAANADRDLMWNQIAVEVEQAKLSLDAAKASSEASEEALVNARERLRLAEARYQTGVGNIIELGDAQLAATSAANQRVQAEYEVSNARARLAQALGNALPQ
jgi:outer membrane protein